MKLRKDVLKGAIAGIVLLPAVGLAADYSRTEAITYHDDTAGWVLGQVKSVTLTASTPSFSATPVEITRTEYGWKSLPTNRSSFGRPVLEIGYNSADGTVAYVKDGAGHTTSVGSWKRGIPQSIAYADGTSQSAVVANDGTVSSITDANGFTTSYEYDEMGRVTKTTFPTGDTTAWAPITQTFDQVAASEWGIPAGHWRQIVSQGNFRSYTYFDALWRPVLTQQFDNTDVVATRTGTVKQYDHDGREVFASYPLATWSNVGSFTEGVITTYDVLGRVREVLQDSELGELSTTTWYGGNANGPYTKVSDPNGAITRTWFQSFDTPSYDTPTTIWHPESAYTHITRDVFGKTTRLRRSNSSSATGGSLAVNRDYTYNDYQQLCRADEPESGTSAMGYDAAGNLAWSAMGFTPSGAGCLTASSVAARRVDRAYDLRNRVTAMSFPDSRGNTTHTYTPDGLPASIMVDNGGGNVVTTTYAYNKRRLLTSERMQWNSIDWTLISTYDANGHLASETLPGNWNVAYAPNALGQPTQAGAYASNVRYFPNGAIKQFTYANGIVHTLTQNARGLAERSRDAYGSTAVHDDSYDYDANANLMAISDGLPDAQGNRSMQYDGLNRLVQVHDAPMLGGNGSASFSYNALDNLLTGWTRDAGAVSYTYDTNNRLTNMRNGAGATVVGLGYDAQGNVDNRNGSALDFDYGNRLRAHGSTSYVYDGLGRRVRDFTGGSKYSLYNQSGKLVFESDVRKQRQRWNIYLGSSLVAVRERNLEDNSTRNLYQHTDGLGSPVAVTDASRNVIERDFYAPYGEQISGPANDGPGYTGHVMDAATGLTYMQQRYYDPQIGRFLSVDPVTALSNPIGMFNRYKYAANNPYRFIDPDGRSDLNLFGANDPLYEAGEAFDIPEMFTLTGHANSSFIQGVNREQLTPDQTIALARAAGLKEGHTFFVGACNVGANGGAYAQALANKNNSLVLAATGFAMFPTTNDPDPTDNRAPYKPGSPVTLTVNSQRDGKGTPGTFAVFAPGRNSPVADGIRSVSFNPETGKAQLRLAPETGSRIGRTVTVCADKEKCG